MRFLAWTKTKPNWTPFRTEWSIYDESNQIAGQVDSLWLNLKNETEREEIVMVDWKRSAHLLSGDLQVQKDQVYNGQRGLDASPHSDIPGPCRDLYDVAFNHYLVQQSLYAHILQSKYGIVVASRYLLQCHPHIGSSDADFNEVLLPVDSELSEQVLSAFHGGWKLARG